MHDATHSLVSCESTRAPIIVHTAPFPLFYLSSQANFKSEKLWHHRTPIFHCFYYHHKITSKEKKFMTSYGALFPLFYYHHKLNFKRENCDTILSFSLELSFAKAAKKTQGSWEPTKALFVFFLYGKQSYGKHPKP